MPKYNVLLENEALQHIVNWSAEDVKTLVKIFTLIKNISQSPFDGLGKPEPLKGNLKGYWSRRITQEHRLVYKVETNAIIVVSAYGHY
jgi:toxin YoeB